ncbi:TcaA NTF2-like domain-containing protein, partial [Staphylococcus aureus]
LCNRTKYIKQPDNNKRFNEEIENIKANIKDDKQYEVNLGSITDGNNKKVITIRKDGKQFFLIDKLAFIPHYTKFYVNERDNTGYYTYNLDKSHHTSSDKNTTSEIGEIFVGDYRLNSNKEIKDALVNGGSDGKLIINTDKTDIHGKVIAEQKFDQSWFKANIKNADNVKSIQIVIDGHKVPYKHNKVYGNYANQFGLEIYGQGKIEGKNFKTSTKDIGVNKNDAPQQVDLSFNEDEMNKYIKESDIIKDKAKDFMEKYTNDLERAYKKSKYGYISKYIKSNTEVDKHMKKMVKSKAKNKYSNVHFEKVERNNNEITIVLTKNVNNHKVKSEYVLDYNSSDESFEIVKYQDI